MVVGVVGGRELHLREWRGSHREDGQAEEQRGGGKEDR